MKKWSSFSVKSPTEIVHEASHPMTHERMFTLPYIDSHDFFTTLSSPQIQYKQTYLTLPSRSLKSLH